MLDGRACGPTDEAILMVEFRPRGFQGFGILLAVEGFEFMAELPILRAR